MYSSFQNFYYDVKDIHLDWSNIEQLFRIQEETYPTNAQMLNYYVHTFKGKTTNFGRSKWHRMDKLLCIWLATQYCRIYDKNVLELEKTQFKLFAQLLGVQSELLEFKWLKLIKPYLKNKPWSDQQDKVIRQLMQSKIANKWTQIAIKLSESDSNSTLRTAKQVRERWMNYLDTEIKRNDWSKKQDQKLLQLIEQHGKKWSLFGKLMKRTENSIKNRYHSLMTRLKQEGGLVQNSLNESRNAKQQQYYIVEPKIATFKMIQQKICGYRSINWDEVPN